MYRGGRLAAHEALWRDSYDALTSAWADLQSPGGALLARPAGRGGRIALVTHAPGAAEVPGPALSRAFGGPSCAPPRTLLFCKPYDVLCSFTDAAGGSAPRATLKGAPRCGIRWFALTKAHGRLCRCAPRLRRRAPGP
jgi:hypothetical protein